MIHSNIKIPNNQERASSLYTPVHPSKKALICLECTNKKCKPRNCERYATEITKIIVKGVENESN